MLRELSDIYLLFIIIISYYYVYVGKLIISGDCSDQLSPSSYNTYITHIVIV